jgi:hypothetical protein
MGLFLLPSWLSSVEDQHMGMADFFVSDQSISRNIATGQNLQIFSSNLLAVGPSAEKHKTSQ